MADQNEEPQPPQEERSKRQERADRILDAAVELIQRWGYKKTTVDDIAKQAGVAKGTIYLHWKTREDLFVALLVRERFREAEKVAEQLKNDPDGAMLHSMAKYGTLVALRNPLIKAVMLRDTDILGDLAHSQFGRSDFQQRAQVAQTHIELLRNKGLIRTDIPAQMQVYMLMAISTGFIMFDQFLPDEYQVSPEEKAEMVAETIRRTFELRDPAPDEQNEVTASFNHILDFIREQRQKE